MSRLIDVEEVKEFIRKSSLSSSIYVGCDSLRHHSHGKSTASYARVVVIHKDTKHGAKVFGDVQRLPDYGSLRMRLMQEVMIAGDLAAQIADVVGIRPFVVHLDVNPDPKEASSIVCGEAIGYIRGLGFDVRVKPEAFIATHCGDHLVRGGYFPH